MSKKLLFLLPIAMLALTGCKGGDDKKSEEDVPAETPIIPTVEASDLKTAYDAAAALTSGATSEMTFDGTVVAKSGNSWFVQKGYCGMYLYNAKIGTGDEAAAPELGKKVTVKSTLQKYYGCIESKTFNSTGSSVDGDGTMEDAIHIFDASQTLDKFSQNIRVTFNLKLENKDSTGKGAWSSDAAPIVKGKLLDNAGEEVYDVTVKMDKWAFNTANGAVFNNAAEGDVLKFENVITTANNNDGNATTNQIMVAGTSTLTAVAQ